MRLKQTALSAPQERLQRRRVAAATAAGLGVLRRKHPAKRLAEVLMTHHFARFVVGLDGWNMIVKSSHPNFSGD